DICVNPPENFGSVPPLEPEGHTIYSTEELMALLGGQEVTSLSQLCEWAKSITLKYVRDGYITSQAIVLEPEDSSTNPAISLTIFEGILDPEDIKITGLTRLREGYVRDRILLGVGTPLHYQDLEDQLQLLRSDPLLDSFTASLGPKQGNSISQSRLTVSAIESDILDGRLSFDNSSPEALGTNRFETGLTFQNVAGIGDTLTTSWRETGELGSRLHRFTYQIPVNAKGGMVSVEANVNRNRIVSEPFNAFDVEDRSGQYEISMRQPLWRSPRDEFALSFGYSYRQAQTTVLNRGTPFGAGPEADGATRLSVLRFSQDYLHRDPQGAWVIQSQFNWGNDWFGATDQEDGIPDSQFLSWLGQVQRYQRVGSNHLLIGRLDLQLTTDALLSAEQFVIGGSQSVRGYRQNMRSADNGFRVSLEDRITFLRQQNGKPSVQLIPFADAGYVWNHSSNPNSISSDRWLAGIGIGVGWEPVPDFLMRLDYGAALISVPDEGNDPLQRNGLHFSTTYDF
uniref:ShlB/FhaC/HecB family hemolysin secretion/activation protein n=1 Tax=Prochlorothrix hollandica TaxID=1223 RepID=UPI0033429B72